MAATADQIAARAGAGKAVAKSILAAVAATVAFFVISDVLKYFLWTEETYGYYWQFRGSLLLHVTGGLAAVVVGVYQLWSGTFRRTMGVHPWTGRVYVAGIVVGSIGGITLGITSAVYGFAWSVGIIVLALAWLMTTGIALHCIRRRDVRSHKQWMIRSYIVTFGFVTFRIVVDYVPYEALWGISRAEMANAMIWTAWMVPLLIYQAYLQYKDA